jgi:hypothetical protein
MSSNRPQLDENVRRLLPAYLLSITVALVAALGSLLYMEKATVKLSVIPQRLSTDVTISGGLSGFDLRTTQLQAALTESQTIPTSTVPIAATPAIGQVVFACSPACAGGYTVPTSTVVATAKGVQYQTQSSVTIPATGPADPVTVRATLPGPAGNTATATVTVIVSHLQSNVHVTNPNAITGGADARNAMVVQQSDFDAGRAALIARVTSDLDAKLSAQASGLSYATSGPPTFNTTSDFNVGDETPHFTITVMGLERAVAFSQLEADALLRNALEHKIPAGYQLTPDPVLTNYRIEAASPTGEVTIDGSATGYLIPRLSTETLKGQLRAATLSAARSRLQLAAPGSTVDIHITPVAWPWLPMIADHISLDVILEPVPVR